MGVQVTNNAVSTLSGSITSVATTLSVQTGHGARFPSASIASGNYFYATLLDAANNIEIVKVTDRSTDTFTVVRARDGTTAIAFSANDRIELRPVAALFNDLPNRLLVNADLTDNIIESVKFKTLAGLSAGTYGGADKVLTVTVNAKGQVTAISEAATTFGYEEGTFTPELKFGGAAVGMTYGTQTGRYTKIGRMVFVNILIILTAKGSSTGSATITGLPFTSSVNNNSVSPIFGFAGTMASLVDAMLATMVGGAGTTLNLYNGAASGHVALTQANFLNTSRIELNHSYFV